MVIKLTFFKFSDCFWDVGVDHVYMFGRRQVDFKLLLFFLFILILL